MFNNEQDFSDRVLRWFDEFGRKGLPWQSGITPYRVWVSEIMLQQTQVATVIPYFQRFMERFPTVAELALASQDDVLGHWTGLGYYARGRNLHRAAQQVISEHDGVFPCDMPSLMALPGIGRSTAAAIVSIACGQAEPILDGNVKRVLARFGAVEGWTGSPAVQKHLWRMAEALMPAKRAADYTQAMMDLGATLCARSRPACDRCPVAEGCLALARSRVKDFPTPKPKKVRPRHQRTFLLLFDEQNRLLLERRPANGLWGGLWSLPEFVPSADWRDELFDSRGLRVAEVSALPAMFHAFSHYELEILPFLVGVLPASVRDGEMASGQAVWYNTAQPLPGGVPAPVLTLIHQFQAERGLATDSK